LDPPLLLDPPGEDPEPEDPRPESPTSLDTSLESAAESPLLDDLSADELEDPSPENLDRSLHPSEPMEPSSGDSEDLRAD